MNTPLILMMLAFMFALGGWTMARSGAKNWRILHERLKAEHTKLLTTHLNTLSKLWALQEAEQRRKQQSLAALDKANAANRAAWEAKVRFIADTTPVRAKRATP